MKYLGAFLTAAVLCYAPIFILLNFSHPDDYGECESYTKNMNGGWRAFKNVPHNIVLCGLDGRFDPAQNQNDEVRLQIFSASNELLAVRYFKPLLGMTHGLMLEYGPDYLIYNDGEGSGYQTKISMPPNYLEWIRARLPRLLP